MTIEQTLNDTGQAHLIDHLNSLDDEKKERLLAQLQDLDWGRLPGLIENHVLHDHTPEPPSDIEPAPYFPLTPRNSEEEEYYARAREEGLKLISDGAVAAFTVAGGQGSRLGYSGPKGQFPISPVKNKSLFQIFSEKIQYHANRHDVSIPWYIMTSHTNHDDTCAFFKENNYFGMAESDVMFFKQGQLPAFTFDGQLILAEDDQLFMSPDGHGGSLKALSHSGALDDMNARGCRYISYFQVDNPLVSVLDPLFIGLHHLEKSEVSSRMLPKRHSLEKIGVFCMVNDKLRIIEYSDLPTELAEAKDENGQLRYIAGSPAIHIFSVDFVSELNDGEFSLPLHRAEKKIPHYVPGNGLMTPESPNGIKLETFVFDSLQFAEHTTILEADRATEFAPVKNAEGSDSPESCRRMMMDVFATWLKHNGVSLPESDSGELLCTIEISPLTAVAEEDLAALTLPDRLTPNLEVYIP